MIRATRSRPRRSQIRHYGKAGHEEWHAASDDRAAERRLEGMSEVDAGIAQLEGDHEPGADRGDQPGDRQDPSDRRRRSVSDERSEDGQAEQSDEAEVEQPAADDRAGRRAGRRRDRGALVDPGEPAGGATPIPKANEPVARWPSTAETVRQATV